MSSSKLSPSKLLDKAKLKMGVTDPAGFKTMPNKRNVAMMGEAETFEGHLIKYKNSCKSYLATMEKFLQLHLHVAKANLPRIWEVVEGHAVLCEPIPANLSADHPNRVGGDFDSGLIEDGIALLQDKGDAILLPIDRWIESLTVAKGRMVKLEALRQAVDKKRRFIDTKFPGSMAQMDRLAFGSFGALDESHLWVPPCTMATTDTMYDPPVEHGDDTADAPMGPDMSGETDDYEKVHSSRSDEGAARMDQYGFAGAGRGSIPAFRPASSVMGSIFEDENASEDHAHDLRYHMRKLEATMGSFHEQEHFVFQQLRGLVFDAAWFKSYVASSLLVLKETMQVMLVGLGACKQPLPGFTMEQCGAGEGVVYGAVLPTQPPLKAGTLEQDNAEELEEPFTEESPADMDPSLTPAPGAENMDSGQPGASAFKGHPIEDFEESD